MLGRALIGILVAGSPALVHADRDSSGDTVTYTATSVADVARVYLERHLRAQYTDAQRLDLQIVGRVPKPKMLPATAQWIPKPMSTVTVARRMCVQIDVVDAGKVLDSMSVWFDVALYREVLVAAHGLRPNAPVAAADFVLAERDTAPWGGATLAAFEHIAGKRVRYYIAPGAVVRSDDLATMPAVTRHQEIQVAVITPSVVVETVGIAQEDGALGQVIKVRNIANKATYFAQVVDSGRAQLVSR